MCVDMNVYAYRKRCCVCVWGGGGREEGCFVRLWDPSVSFFLLSEEGVLFFVGRYVCVCVLEDVLCLCWEGKDGHVCVSVGEKGFSDG